MNAQNESSLLATELGFKSALERASRFLFFTGKGGVGKTSLACASAVALADAGRKVLLVSTDPASNLDEVLGESLCSDPRPIPGVRGLEALNIDPMKAAAAYRERIVGPIRGILPEATVANIEEQLSGACTTEIASFNEFSRLLGDLRSVAAYDHVILDTAPTGHTLRLLALPAAWNDFIADNKTGSTCLGPLSGLQDQKVIYEGALKALQDGAATTLYLVARADEASLDEAARASEELQQLGVRNQALILNALFVASPGSDPVAQEMSRRAQLALGKLKPALARLPQCRLPFRVCGSKGIDRLRQLLEPEIPEEALGEAALEAISRPRLRDLVDQIAAAGQGVVMTMGKGGVGKTSLAKRIARELAHRGHATRLTTTDPANHLGDASSWQMKGLTVSAIDPKEVTRRHVEQVLATAGSAMDASARALLEEELRSPCTEEIAVFTAFAEEVARGQDGFVVLDTAPTGHTLLLLDATEAYHREVLKNGAALPEAVQRLLPRLRDPNFTKAVVVTLPEPTPAHEAAQLQQDLRRAGIEPFAWVVNQCLAATATRHPLLAAKAADELEVLKEVELLYATRTFVEPWA